MKGNIAITIASVALVISVVVVVIQMRLNPLGDGIDKYSFTTPINAYRSTLQMTLNRDILAQIQFNWAIEAKGIQEKLNTLKVAKERAYGGKKLLFIEFEEDGVPKREVVTLEKNASSGFWYQEYVSTYEVEKHDAKLAAEINNWEESE